MGDKVPKDRWDKFQIISQFIGGIILAGVAVVATILYNMRQSETQQLQNLQSLIQHLPTAEDRKTASTIILTGNEKEEIIYKLTELFEKSHSVEAIGVLGESKNPKIRNFALETLYRGAKSRNEKYAKASVLKLKALGSECNLFRDASEVSDCENMLYKAFDLCNSRKYTESIGYYEMYLKHCGTSNDEKVKTEIQNLSKYAERRSK